MNLKIKANHGIEMTEALKNYASDKIGQVVSKFDQAIHVEIELEKTNSHHHHGTMYKAAARVSGNSHFKVESVRDDLYSAIDGLKDKVEYELASVKDKKQTLIKRVAQKVKSFLKR